MSDFHFLYPWRLLLLIPAIALWWLPSAGRSAWSRIMDKPLANALIVGRQRKLSRALPWLVMLGVIALAGPSWQRQLPAALTPESNVMVILQQDTAMLASDLSPSRHQRMQTKIMSLMERMPGTRFGLVVYNAGAWLTTPLTVDTAFYSLFLHAQTPSTITVWRRFWITTCGLAGNAQYARRAAQHYPGDRYLKRGRRQMAW